MLVGYSVQNYKSFKNQQSISFLKGISKFHKDHIVKNGNRELLKSGLIFGANASGKSNFINSIEFSRTIVVIDHLFCRPKVNVFCHSQAPYNVKGCIKTSKLASHF